MLDDLYENNSYEVLKRTAQDRSARRDSERKHEKESAKNLLYSRQLEKKKKKKHTAIHHITASSQTI